MKMKSINSPRFKLFKTNSLTTFTVMKKDINNQMQKNNVSKNVETTTKNKKSIPISINQFKRKQSSLTLVMKQNQFIVKKNETNMLLDNKVKQQQKSKTQQLLLKTLEKQQHTFHNIQTSNILSKQRTHSNNSSRKRRSKYFLNISLKKRQSTSQNTYRENNNYINAVMMTKTQSTNSQSTTTKLYSHSNRSYCYNNRSQSKINRNTYSESFDRQNESVINSESNKQFFNNSNNNINSNSKYENIRNTMKKLKNLSQIKLIQTKKSQRLNTSNDQWQQISKIVQQVCSINKNQQQKNIRVQCQQMDSLHNDRDHNNDADNRVDFTNQQQQQQLDQQQQQQKSQSQSKQQQQLVILNNNQISLQKCHKSQNINYNYNYNQNQNKNQKQQLQQQQQQNINSNNINHHQQIIHQHQQQQQQQLLQYINKFNSLLLVFENILQCHHHCHKNNNIDNNNNNSLDNFIITAVVDKITALYSNYNIQSTTAQNLFLKYYYLQRKQIQYNLQQLYGQIVQNESSSCYKDQLVINRLKQTLINIQKGNQNLKQQLQLSHYQLLLKDSIYEEKTLNQYVKEKILNLNTQFLLQNMKILRKILKKISKNQKTNQKQFHIFLNYAAYFINLTKVFDIVKNIIQNQVKVCNYSSNAKQKQHHQQQIKLIPLFLYTQCGFIRMSYLHMDERQFSKCFQNEKEHQKVQAYYNQLIRELKNLQPRKRQSQ